jgi:CRP/FNR family transcriptional regulator, cyclic AMP receptor protein
MQLRKNAKVELLRQVPLFAQCSKRELETIAGIADEVEVGEATELTTQGDRGREFGVIVDGTASVTGDGKQVASLGAGDFFGEIALVSDIPRTATVKATSPVRLLVVSARDFRRLMRESPAVQNKVLQALAHRVAELSTRHA